MTAVTDTTDQEVEKTAHMMTHLMGINAQNLAIEHFWGTKEVETQP
jgi:hypothetical protein